MPFEARISADLRNTKRLCEEMRYVILEGLRDEAEGKNLKKNASIDFDFEDYMLIDGKEHRILYEEDPNFERKKKIYERELNGKYVVIRNDK
jgi:hypothetical protein